MTRGGRATWLVLPSWLLLAGCERGCAKSWLAERGIGESPKTSPSAIVPLNALDCPDGLARCRDGVVEVSVLATIPHPCAGAPESCVCPWTQLGTCGHACTVDGLELVVEREHAEAQLCAPAAADALSRAPDATTPLVPCDVRGYRCDGNVLEQCDDDGATPRALAVCTHRCAEPGGVIDADGVTGDQAVALLCAHR
jgi:hypothetical protein